MLAALLASWVLFYAWSPPHLTPAPTAQGLWPGPYVATLLARSPSLWIEYWGELGWLEYRLSDAWQWGLVALLAASLVEGVRRWRSLPRDAAFLLAVSGVFARLVVAGEFANLRTSGQVLQGRYFLPASLALAPIVATSLLARVLLRPTWQR